MEEITARLAKLERLTANLTTLEASVANNTATLSTLPGSVDTFYLITCGALVFFTQAGFGLLEAGSVRTKNTRNILIKNLLDTCIGAIVWWAWGFAAAVIVCAALPRSAPTPTCLAGKPPQSPDSHILRARAAQYETGEGGNRFIGGTDRAKGFFGLGWVDVSEEGWEEDETGRGSVVNTTSPPGQCLRAALAPPQGAPGGSGRLWAQPFCGESLWCQRRGRAIGLPGTASGARASRVQRRRLHTTS